MQKPKAKVIVLKESDFAKAIEDKKYPLIIVDFYADWCGPCQMMAPILDRLAIRNPKVKFCKINVDDAPNLSDKFEVSSIPCIIFFKEGREVDRINNSVSQDIFQEKLEGYM